MASVLMRATSRLDSGYDRREHQGSAFQAYGPEAPLRANPLFMAAQQALREVRQQVEQQRQAPDPPAGETSPRILRMTSQTYAAAPAFPEPPMRVDVASPRVKLPVVCNDVRGVVFLDQQVVSCFCPACSARVMDGHDRPLFSFTRFERHTGSKAKKWRLSLRIQPGSVPECPVGEPPMPLGQWLELRGYSPSGQRALRDDASSDSDGAGGSPGHVERRAALARPPAGIGAAGERVGPVVGIKRARASESGGLDAWLATRVEGFEAAARGTWRDRHRAVFGLVFGVLAGERELFHAAYMPWLNDLGLERLDQEFSTLQGYLALLEEGEPGGAVRDMVAAYVRAVAAKAGAGEPGAARGASPSVTCPTDGAPSAVPSATPSSRATATVSPLPHAAPAGRAPEAGAHSGGSSTELEAA